MLKYSIYAVDSVERPVATGSTVTAEGACLIADTSGGELAVKPAAGSTGEQFVGVSLSQQLTIEYLPMVEVASVPAESAYTITLGHTPVAGSLLIVGASTGTIAAGNPGTTTAQYSISGATITFHADQADEAMTISYRYAPTVIEAKTLQGDIPPGGAAGLILDSVGVIRRGDILTSEYDTSVAWTDNPPAVYTGANGLFTTDNSGTLLTNVTVTQVPSASEPFLGLEIR